MWKRKKETGTSSSWCLSTPWQAHTVNRTLYVRTVTCSQGEWHVHQPPCVTPFPEDTIPFPDAGLCVPPLAEMLLVWGAVTGGRPQPSQNTRRVILSENSKRTKGGIKMSKHRVTANMTVNMVSLAPGPHVMIFNKWLIWPCINVSIFRHGGISSSWRLPWHKWH